MILDHYIQYIKNFVGTLAGQCRNKHNLSIRHKGQDIPYLFCEFFHCEIIFFQCIPFIDRYNKSAAPIMCHTGDLGILLRNPFCGINHKDHHIRSFNGSNGTDNTVSLNIFLDLAFTTQSCGINKHILCIIVNDLRINGISCSSCHIRNDHAFFS